MLREKREKTSNSVPTSVSRTSISPSSASRAAQAQSSGLRHVNQLIRNLSAESMVQGPNSSSPSPPPRVLTSEEQLEADKKAVSAIWEKYINDPIISDEGEDDDESRLDDFDIVRYWQVRASSVSIIVHFQ
jgi:hypothetical protein